MDVADNQVLRVLSASIALILTVGQHPALLCLVRCDPLVPATTSACHYEDEGLPRSALLIENASCDLQQSGIPVLVRDEVRRSVRDPDTHHAVLVPRSQRLPSATDLRSGRDQRHERPFPPRPPLTALRI
jgi:hypothetical protein